MRNKLKDKFYFELVFYLKFRLPTAADILGFPCGLKVWIFQGTKYHMSAKLRLCCWLKCIKPTVVNNKIYELI